MDTTRRKVIPLQSFWDDLDKHLPSERGSNGEPSRNDFYTFDLYRIFEQVADDWEHLPLEYSGRNDYKQLIGSGVVVRSYAVLGREVSGNIIELVRILLDQHWE